MAKKENKEEKAFFDLGKEWEVKNARQLDFGTFFTLQLPGLALYNLRVVPAGKKYDAFIAMPEDKGKDGDYYKRFALYLDEKDTEAVIEAVEEAIKEGKRK